MDICLHQLQHVQNNLNIPRTIKEASRRVLDAFVDSLFKFVDQPYLPSQRNFSPVEELGHAVMTGDIEGSIPREFPTGVFIRNGPNPPFGGYKSTTSLFGQSSCAWIEGEGMLHALYFSKDSDHDRWSLSYMNKYVETESFITERSANKPLYLLAAEGDSPAIIAAFLLNMWRFGKTNKMYSNTNVFEHSGKLYSIAENDLPSEIDITTLQTVKGDWIVENSWRRPFTSHPKKVPGTGELVIVGAEPVKPFLVLGVVSADGKSLLHKVDLKLSRSSICHEIGVTERYNVIIDCALTADLTRLAKGGPLLKFGKEEKSYIGIMPRYGNAESVKWFEVARNCTFHIFNCHEDGDEVVVRGCRARESIVPGPDYGHDKVAWFSRGFKATELEEHGNSKLEVPELFARPYEWRVNMRTGDVEEKNLTGTRFSMDFPFINENYTGIKNQYGYAQVVDLDASSIAGMAKFGRLAKLYLEEAATTPSQAKSEELIKVEYHKFEENNFCSGTTFVSKNGSRDEDDGWIVCFVHNEETDVSQLHIIDAKNFEADPVAKITLPQRVPYGFHANYFARTLFNKCVNNLSYLRRS